jgi:uncharacterized membrane protein YgaE (UPF0421/DUF939 family)
MCAVKRTTSLSGQLSEAVGLLRGRLEGPLLHAVKTAVASGFSWFVAANLLGNQIPVFAPLAAVLTVQVTIWQSVSRGLQRVAGVVVGVLVASAFAHVAGIHAWSIAVVIFVSLLLGRAMRLGTQGAIQVPISALLVLVLGATTGGYGLDRVVDTAIGAACGILVNLAVFPRIHLSEANARVRSLAEGLGALVRGVAAWVERAEAAPATPPEDPDALLGAARLLSDRVTAAARAVSNAEESWRWHPAGRRQRQAVENLHAAVPVLEMIERQVRGIARTAAEAGPSWDLPAPAAAALARLLIHVASELEGWWPPDQVGGETGAATPRGELLSADQDGLYESVLEALRGSGPNPHAAAAAAAIAVDARRIREELSATPTSPLATPGWRSLFDQATR